MRLIRRFFKGRIRIRIKSADPDLRGSKNADPMQIQILTPAKMYIILGLKANFQPINGYGLMKPFVAVVLWTVSWNFWKYMCTHDIFLDPLALQMRIA